MSAISILIVEDNIVLQEQLKLQLTKLGFSVCECLDHGEDVLPFIEKDPPDIIIMDIHLAGNKNGIQTVEEINQHFNIPVVYLTDHNDDLTFTKAKLTNPVSFLPKPYNIDSLQRALEIAAFNGSSISFQNKNVSNTSNHLHTNDTRFYIKLQYSLLKIEFSDIVYLKADGAYCFLHTIEKSYHFSKSLNNVAKNLPENLFMRVHKSYVVNLDQIDKITGNTIQLSRKIKDEEVVIGKTYREKLFQRIQVIP